MVSAQLYGRCDSAPPGDDKTPLNVVAGRAGSRMAISTPNPSSSSPPDFLAIGHIALDISAGGPRLGGAAAYAALTARALGARPAVVTSVGPQLDPDSVLPAVSVVNVPSAETTTFRNSYREGVRTQLLSAVAAPIALADIPVQWLGAKSVFLGPIAGEVSPELVTSFRGATILASIQGWLRRRNPKGEVTPASWDGGGVLPHVAAAICSVEDIGDHRQLDRWMRMVPVLILTRGREGACLHYRDIWHHIEPVAAEREVDPTGAGDVFAAAYQIRFQETSNPLESAHFANCAASLSVEAEGVSGIPSRARVQARLDGSR